MVPRQFTEEALLRITYNESNNGIGKGKNERKRKGLISEKSAPAKKNWRHVIWKRGALGFWNVTSGPDRERST